MAGNATRPWETVEDRPRGRDVSSDPYVTLFQGPEAAPRVAAVRRALARALDDWWRQGQMLPRGLLRDGLLILEAGHDLDDAQRTLLLRAAFYYGKGMATALRHQTDPERTASVIRDMLLQSRRPLSPAQVREALARDPHSLGWRRALLQLLRVEAGQSLEPRRTLAEAALFYLRDEKAAPFQAWTPLSSVPAAASRPRARRRRARLGARQARGMATVLSVLAVLLVALGLLFFWQDLQLDASDTGETSTVPAGIYLISNPAPPVDDRLVQLVAFTIDRTEVTNRAYRRCYEAGACTWPARTTSIMRPDYFLAPPFDDFPMINVTWAQAASYCAWAGKRLPLEEEWEVAAGSALTLKQRYLFPWGDFFDPARTNSVEAEVGDTLPVGVFSPAGDSPSGVADMAGNVAEWTATPADPHTAEPDAYIVKGGSFLDIPADLRVSSRRVIGRQESRPWLGFRCAVTLPDPG